MDDFFIVNALQGCAYFQSQPPRLTPRERSIVANLICQRDSFQEFHGEKGDLWPVGGAFGDK